MCNSILWDMFFETGAVQVDLQEGKFVVDYAQPELFKGMSPLDPRVALERLQNKFSCNMCKFNRRSGGANPLVVVVNPPEINNGSYSIGTISAECEQLRSHLNEMARKAKKFRKYEARCLNALDQLRYLSDEE